MARIMVLDDEPLFRRKLADILTAEGHSVTLAAAPAEAIAAGRAESFDLLVADWMLKDDLSGVDVVMALRQNTPQLPALIITGYPSAEFSAELEKYAGIELLRKPFDLEQFTQAVRGALG